MLFQLRFRFCVVVVFSPELCFLFGHGVHFVLVFCSSFVACFVLLQLCWFCVCLVVCCFMFSLEFHPSITYFPDDFSSRCADDGMGFPVAAVCRPGSIGFVLFGGEFQRYGEVVVVMVVMVVMVGGAELLMWGGWMLMWCG
jgi:hypothetical protein